ncbi:DUF4190 domain-containing protein [Streptomyces sp. NPDC056244]|uniref:DUF4190 domain-containing protein n=1 Tax=Streptomyces sp. NPDC056244 TaxID=3345762 RepID=UPI0035D56F5E
MSDKSEQPSGGYEPSDPWAPPEHKAPQNDPVAWPEPQPPAAGSVHDQPTVAGIPGSGPEPGAVPPPPVAPGGPAQPAPGPYGYPGTPPQPAPGAQQSASPYGATPGYGYPAADYPAPGYPAPGYPDYGSAGWQPGPSNGMGIAAMVLGIISVVVFCLWGIGVIVGVLALVLGVIGRRKVQRGQATNGGMALAGIVLGAIGAVISAAFLGLMIWVVANGESLDPTTDTDPFATSLAAEDRR